jgi:xanthine/uracil permease
MAIGWKFYGDGKTPPPGAVVKPDERLSWPRTVGLGAQHAVMMSGVATILSPAVTGAVVMLIGFNLAPVAARIYWPQDQWIAPLTMTFVILTVVLLPGFWSRIAIFLGLIFGFCPKFGALVGSTPGGVLGGITVVLYGMIVVVVFYHLLHVLAPAHLKDALPMGGEEALDNIQSAHYGSAGGIGSRRPITFDR